MIMKVSWGISRIIIVKAINIKCNFWQIVKEKWFSEWQYLVLFEVSILFVEIVKTSCSISKTFYDVVD